MIDSTTLRNNERACAQMSGRSHERCSEELRRLGAWNEPQLQSRRDGLERAAETNERLAGEWDAEARRHRTAQWTEGAKGTYNVSRCVHGLYKGRFTPQNIRRCEKGVDQAYESALAGTERRAYEQVAETTRDRARQKRDELRGVENDLWYSRELQNPSLRERPWDHRPSEPSMTPWNPRPASTPQPVEMRPLGSYPAPYQAPTQARRRFDWGKLANGLTTTLNVLTQVGSAYVEAQATYSATSSAAGMAPSTPPLHRTTLPASSPCVSTSGATCGIRN